MFHSVFLSNNLEYLNYILKPRIVGFLSDNNGGLFVIAMKNLKKYRSFSDPKNRKWTKWEKLKNDTDNRFLEAVTADQITDDVFNRFMFQYDPEYLHVQAKKDLIASVLGQEYHLGEVGTMLGTLPVISKEEPGTGNEVSVAHLFPGEQTDALDGAPKKDFDQYSKIPEFRLYYWLSKISEEKLQTALNTAITNLNRPEKHLDWYDD